MESSDLSVQAHLGIEYVLRNLLPQALRARDRVATRTIREALAAIANAEAVPVPVSDPGEGPIAGSRVGVGSTDAPRVALDETRKREIVAGEAREHRQAATTYGDSPRGGEHAAAAALLEGMLGL